jgi:O-antigen ligase
MVAIGYGLALWERADARKYATIALAILGAGLAATVSRGPWIGALVLIIVYLATGPSAIERLAKFAAIAAALLLPLLFTSIGAELFAALPFVGSVDSGSVIYRQNLFSNAIEVIARNPWFGSSDYLSAPEMQQMMQGEHIIDIVNSYLKVALDSGFVGLGFFLAFFVAVLSGLWRTYKLAGVNEMGLSPYVRASMATLIAILVTIGTVSSVDFIPWIYWSISGLCVALVRIVYHERTAVVRTTQMSGLTSPRLSLGP